MDNQELIEKLKKDMEMRNFSHYTYTTYLLKTKEMIRYFKKPMEEVTIEELRNFLLEYLKKEKGLSDRTVNYYNSIIRFVYEVTLDMIINKKQLPMQKKKKSVYKVLTKKELSAFFDICDFKYKTIFMLIYGSGLRIGEVIKLRKQDIDSEKMRLFVMEGKGNKERYTILPQISLEMLREYWKNYRPKSDLDEIFISKIGKPMTQYVIRTKFREYRRKLKLDEKIVVHTLRHRFCNRPNRKRSKYYRSKRTNGT